jgi:periplasmic divalent cation tolerance protein
MDDNEAVLALSTFPDTETARSVVRQLVEEKLVACGNIMPGVESIYRWQNKIESSGEVIVFFKLSAIVYDRFEEKMRSLHPNEVPEIICVPITKGSPKYLRWVADSCIN